MELLQGFVKTLDDIHTSVYITSGENFSYKYKYSHINNFFLSDTFYVGVCIC